MLEILLKGVELLWKVVSGRTTRTPVQIYSAESNFDTYFNIPSADRNDYPENGQLSYVQLQLTFTVETPTDQTLHAVHAFLWHTASQTLAQTFDVGPAAKVVSTGAELSRVVGDWVDRHGPFVGVALKAGSSTKVVVPKYCRVDSSLFHKSQSPFTVCVVLHLNANFVRLLLRVPLSGTGSPRMSKISAVLSELELGSLPQFAIAASETGDVWTNYIRIKPKFRLA